MTESLKQFQEGLLPKPHPRACIINYNLLRMSTQQPPFAVRGRVRPVFGAVFIPMYPPQGCTHSVGK